jgi:hypothetical protein
MPRNKDASADTGQSRWIRLVCRALDIPDAVSDENALLAIQGWI